MAKLSPRELLDRVRARFLFLIDAKINWERNEVKAAFEAAENYVVRELLEEEWQKDA